MQPERYGDRYGFLCGLASFLEVERVVASPSLAVSQRGGVRKNFLCCKELADLVATFVAISAFAVGSCL